ncbi:MAG: dihydrolipoyLLysine-residue succinyltransferase component of 2-oxoglutarate dehydrogenase complex, partial [Chlamydiota bacterium]
MKHEIRTPSVGESVVEATVGNIIKPSGAHVKVDDEILELETDKVNQVVYAPIEGVVHLEVKKGDVVKVGDKLGFIDTAAEAKT